jgi:subtilase family serine protease
MAAGGQEELGGIPVPHEEKGGRVVRRSVRRRRGQVRGPCLPLTAVILLITALVPALMTATPAGATEAARASVTVAASAARPTQLPANVQQVCPTPTVPGYAACLALRLKGVPAHHGLFAADSAPSGYGPADLQSAYDLAAASAAKGAGRTVAIVDAYDDPDAESDLAIYRAQYGLPACTTANDCFQKVNELGTAGDYPNPDAGWATEISLDLDMVSATCPNCHILLVEANSNSEYDLGTSVNTAVSMGAKYVSNTYGESESPDLGEYDGYYDHPGVVITVAAGDDGYGVEWPSDTPYVTAVGGTSLLPASNSRGWAEIAWGDTGSGCSEDEPKPSWQQDTGCANRTVADVSAVADPYTGVAIYDSYLPDGLGWMVIGGTSVATPIIASVYALAGTPAENTYPASYPYADPGDLNDVLYGTNDPYSQCSPTYLCNAGPGYDGPTGLGTPDGLGAFTAP